MMNNSFPSTGLWLSLNDYKILKDNTVSEDNVIVNNLYTS